MGSLLLSSSVLAKQPDSPSTQGGWGLGARVCNKQRALSALATDCRRSAADCMQSTCLHASWPGQMALHIRAVSSTLQPPIVRGISRKATLQSYHAQTVAEYRSKSCDRVPFGLAATPWSAKDPTPVQSTVSPAAAATSQADAQKLQEVMAEVRQLGSSDPAGKINFWRTCVRAIHRFGP